MHSFACFLTPRASEQIYNNASEGTKVIYGGFLAGIVPGGPGHSHQSIRDIALMGSVPGMTCLEPVHRGARRARCVEYAVDEATGPVYLRFVSVPWELGFEPPEARAARHAARAPSCARATSAAFVCTGPVLRQPGDGRRRARRRRRRDRAAVAARHRRRLARAARPAARPWSCSTTTSVSGGQGDAVRAALGGRAPIHVWGVESVPAGGGNDEVLRAHGLDAASLAARLEAISKCSTCSGTSTARC